MNAIRFAFAFTLLAAAPALAQTHTDTTSKNTTMGQMGTMHHPESMGSMNSMGGMHHNASMHMMPATVTSVDAKTGMVEVNSDGMALKLHFPPASLNGLKAGDKITLHLGFTKA